MSLKNLIDIVDGRYRSAYQHNVDKLAILLQDDLMKDVYHMRGFDLEELFGEDHSEELSTMLYFLSNLKYRLDNGYVCLTKTSDSFVVCLNTTGTNQIERCILHDLIRQLNSSTKRLEHLIEDPELGELCSDYYLKYLDTLSSLYYPVTKTEYTSKTINDKLDIIKGSL